MLNSQFTATVGFYSSQQNCVAAMRALGKTDETVTLWIDSICIDQSNLAEKSMQVALMGQIYSLASSVMVGLANGIMRWLRW